MEPSENCFDGTDDDASGMADCADPTCSSVAICAPMPSDGTFAPGILVAADAPCPEGFDAGETVIHQGLVAPECEGCTCSPVDTTCQADLYLYASMADCEADTAATGGARYGVITPICTMDPVSYSYAGARAVITVSQQTCTVAGTPTPGGAMTWARSQKFCRASRMGTGCGAQQACVARAAAPAGQCVLADGAHGCDAYLTAESDWYTGVQGAPTCEACTCIGEGGSCEDVVIAIGSDYSCTMPPAPYFPIHDGERTCSYSYSPKAQTVGVPTPPTSCSATSVASGATATGQSTLCCTVQ
jgi:hypothetical protein